MAEGLLEEQWIRDISHDLTILSWMSSSACGTRWQSQFWCKKTRKQTLYSLDKPPWESTLQNQLTICSLRVGCCPCSLRWSGRFGNLQDASFSCGLCCRTGSRQPISFYSSTTGMAQLLLLSALLAEFRDCSPSVLGMLGRLHHLDLHQHLESVPFHESIQLEAG